MDTEYEPASVNAVKMANGLVVTVMENDPAILDDIIPAFEVSAEFEDSPLLNPETMHPMVYGANDTTELRLILDHYRDLIIERTH